MCYAVRIPHSDGLQTIVNVTILLCRRIHLFIYFFLNIFPPDFCNPFFQSPSVNCFQRILCTTCACRHNLHLASWESRDGNHVFLRDMVHQPAASYHMTVETFTGEAQRVGGITLSSLVFQSGLLCALLPVGGGIVHMINASFGEQGAHTGTPWGHRESQRTPHRNALSPTPAKV